MDFDRKPVFEVTDLEVFQNEPVESDLKVTQMTPPIFENIKRVVSELLIGEWMTLEELHFHTGYSLTLLDMAVHSLDKDTQSISQVWRRGTNQLEFSMRPPKE